MRGRTRRKRRSLPTAREPNETAAGRSPDTRPAGSLAVDLQPPEPREALPCLPSKGRRHVVTAARAGGTSARASVPVTLRGDTALRSCVVSAHSFFSQTLDVRTVLRWEPCERHGWTGSEALGVRSASSWSEGEAGAPRGQTGAPGRRRPGSRCRERPPEGGSDRVPVPSRRPAPAPGRLQGCIGSVRQPRDACCVTSAHVTLGR